jgi:hypothetical protein
MRHLALLCLLVTGLAGCSHGEDDPNDPAFSIYRVENQSSKPAWISVTTARVYTEEVRENLWVGTIGELESGTSWTAETRALRLEVICHPGTTHVIVSASEVVTRPDGVHTYGEPTETLIDGSICASLHGKVVSLALDSDWSAKINV